MDPLWQSIFFGIGVALFVFAFVISLVRTPEPDRLLGLNWVALGLAFCFFVAFVINVRAA